MQISMERSSPAYMIFDIYKKIISKYNIYKIAHFLHFFILD